MSTMCDNCSNFVNLERQLNNALRELDLAKEIANNHFNDTEMLNWLQTNADRLNLVCDLAKNFPFWFETQKGERVALGSDLRDAIKKAISYHL